MLSWFRKKSGATPAATGQSAKAGGPVPAPTPARASDLSGSARLEEIARRWDAAIAQLLRQGEERLARACAESEAELAALGADFQGLSRLWSRTQAELRPLGEQLSNVWDTISDELALEAPPEGVMRREGAKRDLARTELDIGYTRAFRAVMARAAQDLQKRAEQGGDEALRAVFVGAGAHHLGEHAGQQDWERMQRAQTRINGYRDRKDVPLSLLEELESSARRYYTTVLEVEARHAPLQRPYVTAKLERYMKDVERTLRQHWQWRARGGSG